MLAQYDTTSINVPDVIDVTETGSQRVADAMPESHSLTEKEMWTYALPPLVARATDKLKERRAELLHQTQTLLGESLTYSTEVVKAAESDSFKVFGHKWNSNVRNPSGQQIPSYRILTGEHFGGGAYRAVVTGTGTSSNWTTGRTVHRRVDKHQMRAVTLKHAQNQSMVDDAGIGLFGYFADILKDKDFEGCNKMLEGVDVPRTHLQLLVSVLAGTSNMPREQLLARPKLYEDIFNKYVGERGEREAVFALRKFQ